MSEKKLEVIDENTKKPWIDNEYIGNFATRFFETKIKRDGHNHWIDHISYFDGTSGPAGVDWKELEDPDDWNSKVINEGTIHIHCFPWIINMPARIWHSIYPLTDKPVVHCCIFSGAEGDAAGVSREHFHLERISNG